MKKRITALLLALCLILSAAPVYAGAATGQQVSANAVTVTAGNTAYVTLEAKDFENIAALDVYVYYDASVFTVSGTTNGNMLSGAQASINTAVAGEIKLSALALDGMNGTGTLLTIRLSTAWGCAPGTYPIIVAVGRAHDGNLAEAVISGADGSVTVNKPAQAEYFYLYGDVSASTVRMGDTLSCYVYNSNSYSFVSGEFIFNYDHELFSFDAVTLAAGLTGEGAIHSVNSSVLGQVRIVYASDKPVSPHLLFTVSLKAIGDVDATSTVKAQASNMYKEDLTMYQPGSWSRSVMFKKLQLNDYPNAFLRSEQMIVGQQSTSVFAVEAGSGMAAADFTLTYDPAVLRCVSVAAADGLSEKGGMIIINENFGDGMIRFSYVNMDAYDETELPLVVITWEPLQSPGAHYQITGRGVGVVDTDQKPVVLEYVPDSDCIFVRTVIAPTCLLDGYTDHVCACGENFQTDTTPQLGHDIRQFAAKEETCTEVGWGAYEGCIRCNYGTYVEIPALGHDEIVHEAQAQTCLGIGWETYVTCARCDYSTYEELPALGHRVVVSTQEIIDPIQVQNDSDVPFVLENGIYYSNNHDPSSSAQIVFTAQQACTVKVIYGVSSEQSCDKLYVMRNNSQLAAISGTDTSQRTRTLSLTAGTKLTVRYTKDSSVDAGEDRGWVKLEYDVIVNNIKNIVPAETLEPDCTNPVVCSYCDTVVKETVDHKYEPSFTWNWNHTSCDAVFYCSYDCGEKKTEPCTVSVVSADDRRTTHTAKVCVEGKNYTDTMTCDHHLVRFLDWDGEELRSAYYHVGSQVTPPADPTREADETTVYTFAGWDPAVDICKENTTYTATYTGEAREYTVIFKNWDGTVLSEETYYWAEPITFPGAPTRPADNVYTYRFKGWETWRSQCYGDAVYVAQYDADYINYTVTFKDWNGNVLSQNYYHWGDAIAAPVSPERGPDSACTYEFAGWDKEVTSCAGNTTYKATYTPTYIDYVVIFRNWDGTQLSQATYHWGDQVTPPADPTREGDLSITYYFAGWDKTVGPCYGDTTYTAVFTTQKIKYTVIFQNWDGTQLSKRTYYWGDAVTAPAAPKKAADNTYTYAFAGWDEEVVPCAGNTTYTATFTPIYIDYTVAFKDWNGAELSSNTYHWGEAVVAPAEPQRAADNTYTYAFAGWDKQVIACAGNATYTATYTAAYINYTVTFQNWDGTQLSQKTYHWGDKVTPPANPAKEKDGYYAYTFAGWDKTVVNCAGDAVYQAVFTKEHYHTYDRQVTPPNCTEKGYTTFTCACGHSYQGDYVGALGHSYQTTVVKPTYTQKGYTDYVCHCGSTDRKNFKDPLGLPEPAIKVSVDQNRDMQVITWNAVPEATGYEIYRATSKSGKYSLVAQIESVSWHDATASVGKTYYYKVKAVCNSDTSCNSGYSNIVSILFKCAAPEIAVKNDTKGKPYITWEKVTGAKKYTVYRATSATGKYSKLGTTTKAYYTDSKAKAGTTYFYKVIANASSSKYSSGYSNIVSCPVICGTPSVTVKIDSNTGKPSLSWKKVDGAANYAIYRDGQLLATTTGVSYADKAAAIDTQYTYTVQALGKTESLNGKHSNAVTATSGIAKPVLAGSINGVTGKPVISWQAVEGAVKYELYRSTKSTKSYTLLATVDTLSYTDETVSSGKTYYYKVKAIGEVSKSAESSYVKLTGKCATPVITVAVSESSGKPVLTWEKISGAKKYTVYYATSAAGKYKSLGTTTKTTYTHTKATAGTVYFYKIVANASSSKYNSPYSNIVSCGVNCAAPVVKVSLNSSGKPALSWGKVTGAVRYEIYKNGQLLTTVTTTGYTDTAAQAGESCSYTVKAINNIADYNSALSNGVTVTATCATPKITGKVGENKKPVITWAEVEGATKYIVYRSTSKSKNYKVIGETEAPTYEDLTAAKSKTYYYKVVAVGDGFQSAQSGYAKVKSK